MSKARVDVTVVLEMSLEEALNVADVLGRQLAVSSTTGEVYNVLMDALELLPAPTKGVE